MSAISAISRLAARDVRRHPGRALLTMLLVAVPVAAAVFVSTWMRTAVETPQEQVTQQMGTADLQITGTPSEAASIAREPGWRVLALRFVNGLAQGSAGQGRRHVGISNLDGSDPLVDGLVELHDGRWPSAPAEAVVSPRMRDALGVQIGDTLALVRPQMRVNVVGIGGRDYQVDVIVKGALPTTASEYTRFLIDADGPVTAAQRARYGTRMAVRDDLLQLANSDTARRDSTYLYLLSGLGLAAFGLIISAALAVGSRRQMREIGVMRAGGASGTHAGLRVRLYGLLIAVIGTVAGVAAGLATAPLARGFVERRNGPQGALEFSVVDIVMIALFAVVVVLVAAIGPSRASAHVPVLSALAGRRPLAPARMRVPMLGIGVFVAGCFATAAAVGSASTNRSLLLILAVALTLAGVVMCTPYLVGRLEGIGSRARGSQRLALRALARQRSRSGPMAAAIMAAGCLAIGGATYVLAIDRDQQRDQRLRPETAGAVSFVLQRQNVEADTGVDVSCEETLALIRREVEPLMQSPVTACLPYRAALTADGNRLAVVDPDVVEKSGNPLIAGRLRSGRIVAFIGSVDDLAASGNPYHWLAPFRSRLVTMDAPMAGVIDTLGPEQVWIGTATARAIGLRPGAAQAIGVVRQAKPFSRDQSRLIERLLFGADLGAELSTATDDVFLGLTALSPTQSEGYRRIVYAIILPVGIILSLLTVAVGLFLLNAESRDERTALAALGAGPAERRRQNAWQAGALALVAMALALPPGLALPFVVMHAANTELTYGVPWAVLAVLVIGVPLVAAAGAFVFTRSRVPAVPRRV